MGRSNWAAARLGAAAATLVIAGAVTTSVARADTTYGSPQTFLSNINDPQGLAFTASGDLLISQNQNGADDASVLEATPSGQVSTFASGFNAPYGVAVGAGGDVYVSDYGHHQVVELDGSGAQVGTFPVGAPYGLAVDSAGDLYVANFGVDEFPNGQTTSTPIGSGWAFATSLALDAQGDLYVVDQGAGTVTEFPAGGGSSQLLASGLSYQAKGIAVDGSGDVFISGGGAVSEIPAGGGSPNVIASGFSDATGLAVDASGDVFVSDAAAGTVSEIPAQQPALQPALSVESSQDFGSVTIGGEETSHLITVTNTGGADLHIGSLSIGGAGPNAGEFSIVYPVTTCANATVQPGDSCQIGVQFFPDLTTGAAQATLSVPSDAAGSPATVTLTGTGVPRLDPTTTNLYCTRLGFFTGKGLCLATVTDTAAHPSKPTGTIAFSGTDTVTTSPATCKLIGLGATSGCLIVVTAQDLTAPTVTGTYSGSATQATSSATHTYPIRGGFVHPDIASTSGLRARMRALTHPRTLR